MAMDVSRRSFLGGATAFLFVVCGAFAAVGVTLPVCEVAEPTGDTPRETAVFGRVVKRIPRGGLLAI